jgi:PHD/YefM family antitoxin component YafN of YafNO toxin-antitoxin module
MLYCEKVVKAENNFGEAQKMSEKTLNPQYVLDKSGKKAFVVLPVDEYESLLEDLQDMAVIAERRDEPKISLEEFERSLKADGIL